MKHFFKKIVVFSLLFCSIVLFLMILNIILIRNNRDAYLMEFFIKQEMLIEKHRRKQPSLILLGGSNVAFGFNSGMLRDSLNIPVINAGLHAGSGLKFMLDNTSKYLMAGDILIIAPEYEHFYGHYAYGDITEELITLFCINPSISKEFDMKQFKQMILGTENFFRRILVLFRILFFSTETDKIYSVSGFNEYGDVVKHWGIPSRPYNHVSPAHFKVINTNFLDYCENAVATLRSRGVQVIVIPPSFAETSYRKVEARLLPLFPELEKRNLGFSTSPQESAYPDSLFFDTHYHLGYEGVLIRTKQLVRMMKNRGVKQFSTSLRHCELRSSEAIQLF